MSFAQNLEAVANPDDQSAVGGKFSDAPHDWREPRYRTTAKVIAIAESTRQHDALRAMKLLVLVPQYRGFLADHLAQRVYRPVVVK
jgi:hypothetical protein